MFHATRSRSRRPAPEASPHRSVDRRSCVVRGGPRPARRSTAPLAEAKPAVDPARALPELQALLEKHLAQLTACRQSFREDLSAAPTEVKDTVDCSVDHFERSVSLAVFQASSATVRGIEAALQRLHDGTYGLCGDCEEPIAAARLKVLPFAERCRDCQEECDANGRGFLGERFAAEAEV
jgi:RNA polymerase-binding transcription factor DksA